MPRWLLPLAAFCALAAATRSCRCVDPVSCPEALLSRPRGCRLRAGGPGVCCPPARASRSRSFAASSQTTRSFFGGTPFLPGGGVLDAAQLGQAALPAGARRFLGAFPLDTADAGPLRPRAAAAGLAPSGDRRFLTSSGGRGDGRGASAQFSAQGPTRPAPASASTRVNFLNARTSSVSQRRGAEALRALRGVRAAAAGGSTPTRGPAFAFGSGNAAPASDGPQVSSCTPEPPIACSIAAKYRTANGQCNNLQQPRWGRSLTGLRRIFDSTYEDGVFAPRSRSAAGGTLPSARAVSVSALTSESRPADDFTMSLVTWGQFMDHDLSISPIFQRERPDGRLEPIECCDDSGRELPPSRKHPQCLPIAIAADDPFYGRHGLRCMNFVRSLPAADPLCRPRPATQLNDLTSWVDCSQVYGSNDEQTRELRAHKGGLMRTSAGNLLPREVPSPKTNCTSPICFIAGDERVNENTLLTLFHTLFVREHNRVARALAARHSWSDETLFQEARRIVIAEWQHITYREWLPALVGFEFAHEVGLNGFGPRAYVPELNPTVSTEFSTAGFRLHSMVQGVIELVSRLGSISRRLQLTDNFFRPDSLVVANMFTEMARGLTRQQPQSFDKRFTQAVRGDLFKVGAVGLDLMSLNIQRGREHAVPVYATVASRCNGFPVGSWPDMERLIPAADVQRLQATYKHWRDVDLFVGINMERLAPGALIGPTARCLLADQFLRARYGDRFFYDQAGQRGSFTAAQLQEISKATWARLLCDNVGSGFDAVQPLAFIKPMDLLSLNPVVSCTSPRIQRVDLSKF